MDELRAKELQLADRDKQVQDLASQLDGKTEQLEEVMAELSAKCQQLFAAEKQLQRLQTELDIAKRQSSAASKTEAEKEAHIRHLGRRVEDLTAQLCSWQQDAERQRFEKEMQDRQNHGKEVAQLQQKITSLEAEKRELAADRDREVLHVQRLEKAIREKEASQESYRCASRENSLGRSTACGSTMGTPNAGVARRLFAVEGTCTPPVPAATVPAFPMAPAGTMPGATAVATIPTMPVPTFPHPGPLSARCAAQPLPTAPCHASRVSPRSTMASSVAQPWAGEMAWGQRGAPTNSALIAPAPPSPQHRQRPFLRPVEQFSSEALQQVPQVRSIISDFERRSNSQGAPVREQPVTRQLVYGATTGASAGPATYFMSTAGPCPVAATGPAAAGAPVRRAAVDTGSSTRSGSREVAILNASTPTGGLITVSRRVPGDAEPRTPQASTMMSCEEQTSNFGMSPISRQYVHRVAAVATSSPSSRSHVSVKDRIKQLDGRR